MANQIFYLYGQIKSVKTNISAQISFVAIQTSEQSEQCIRTV